MTRKRPVEDDDDGGLDALLDTMTNVVGILVLVLIVTQMGVADVITTIKNNRRIDAAQVQMLQEQIESKQTEHLQLREMMASSIELDPEELKRELQSQQEQLMNRRQLVQEKNQERNQFAIKIDQDRQQAEKNKQLIADTEQQRNQLQPLILASLNRKAELEAMLDDSPQTDRPAPIQISVPNPRPAPAGSQEIVLICKDNRLYPADPNYYRKSTEAKAKAIIAKFNLDSDPTQGIDPESFSKHYVRLKEQNDFIQVNHFVEKDRYPRFQLIPREGKGAAVKEVQNPRSRIRTKWLTLIDPTKYYVRFYVMPDSFEVYLATRRVLDDAGVLAGWQPQGLDWVFTSGIPGGIELGPPPPPAPPAPPPSPDAPKPAPVKPPNVID